jgi:protein O-mannosyl-transferase
MDKNPIIYRRYLEWFISLLLAAGVLAVFWPIHGYDFVNFDDDLYYTNPYIQSGLGWKGIHYAFSTGLVSHFHYDMWMPVTQLSYLLTFELFGMNPSGHHLTSIFLHISNTVLLFWVLRRMTGALWPSAFVAVLFAIHPLHVESVAWISDLNGVLSALFLLLILMAYISYVARRNFCRYSLVAFWFLMGLMSSPILVTLPVVLLILDYWPLNRFSAGKLNELDQKKVRWGLFLEKIPLLLLSTISSIITYYGEQKVGSLSSLDEIPLETRFANALIAYTTYIRKMVWPSDLAVFYPYPSDIPSSWQIMGVLLFLASISILAFWWIKTRPYLAAGWLWYLVTLVPVIGLIHAGAHLIADRYTYISLIGLFIAIGWGVPDMMYNWPYRRIILKVSTGLLIVILTIVTRAQLSHWENSITLFEHTLRVTEDNYLAHNNLGTALDFRGMNQEAMDHYNEALKINPFYANAHINLGKKLVSEERFDEAVGHFRKALRYTSDPRAHQSLKQWEERIRNRRMQRIPRSSEP